MADQLAPLAMHGLRIAGENYDAITKQSKKGWEGIKKVQGTRKNSNGEREDYYYYSSRNRDSGRSRAKSAGDHYDRGRRESRGRDYYDDYYDSYESEASIPPVNRKSRGASGGVASSNGQNSNSQSQTRSQTQNSQQQVSTRGGGGRSTRATSTNNGSSSSKSSSSDDEDLGSSTDDEKKEKKLRRGELITGGLAAVASVHAAGTVWNSMNARDAREEAVASGELTKEEAKRERRKNQFQDVAALGLAALAIKGAYGKWKGTAEQHKSKQEHKKARAERHEKRVQKGLDRESRRSRQIEGPPTSGGHRRREITDGRPSYNRAYSQSETDLSRGGGRGHEGGGGRRYEDRYDDYYYDPRYDDRRDGYSGRV